MSSGVVSRPTGFRPEEISSLINRPVVETHAREAAFLWTLRSRAVGAPHYRLKHLRKIDARVTAHLEGLRIARDDGWQAALEVLADLEGGPLFVAAALAFSGRDVRQMNHVVQLALTDPALEAALVSALSWLEPEPLRPVLDRLCISEHAVHRRIALAALAAHRLPADSAIARAVDDPDPGLRAVALRAIAETRNQDYLPLCRRALTDTDAVCRFWAGCALAFDGDQAGTIVALQTGVTVVPLKRAAVEVALRCGEPRWARDVVRAWAASPEATREGIHAIGAVGDPVTVPWLLDRMDEETQARAAAESLSMITGVDLKYSDLATDVAEDEEVDPEDADLPKPDVGRVREWWHAHRTEFQSGSRYLAGRPISATTAAETLRDGYQRQRIGAAIELAQASNRPMFAVTARADWQSRWLAP